VDLQMKVSELIAELQKMPQEMRVLTWAEVPGGWVELSEVKIEKPYGETFDAVFVG
jgi:hypothetical protein